jgi:hypothetical protein
MPAARDSRSVRRPTGQVERDDERVARTGHETGNAGGQANRRRRSEHERREDADPEAREQRNGARTPAGARRTEHEAIDAGIEVAEGAQALPQVVDARVRRWNAHR